MLLNLHYSGNSMASLKALSFTVSLGNSNSLSLNFTTYKILVTLVLNNNLNNNLESKVKQKSQAKLTIYSKHYLLLLYKPSHPIQNTSAALPV